MKWIGASVVLASVCAVGLWGTVLLVSYDSPEVTYWLICGTIAVVLFAGTGFIARRVGPGWLGPISIVLGTLSVFAVVYCVCAVLALESMGPLGPPD
jgi:hypothetical protein